ncbi:MAG TPA: LPXTG cell wall anchor domain-containing protein [Actinomycetota bacterium]|nr:LPXTG cell wall anchor domain-containing protein [Actinomycetota bacterium]
MNKRYRAILMTALIGLFVMALATSSFANGTVNMDTDGSVSTQADNDDDDGDTVDLGPATGLADDATDGGLKAAAVGELGDTAHGPCVKDLMDLPALRACEDAQGRAILDLPALKLVGPTKKAHHHKHHGHGHAPNKLPTTGVNVGDMLAMGMAALSGGGIFLRRLRFSFAR